MKDDILERLTFSVNNAPAVRYPVGRSSFQGYFLLVCGLAGLLVGGCWIFSAAAIGSVQLFFFAVLVVVLLLAGDAWRSSETGFLVWGGESWLWTTSNQSSSGSMVVHLDIQSEMVVTLRDDRGRSVWLWLERASDPLAWRALRRAIHADKSVEVATKHVKEEVNTEVSL